MYVAFYGDLVYGTLVIASIKIRDRQAIAKLQNGPAHARGLRNNPWQECGGVHKFPEWGILGGCLWMRGLMIGGGARNARGPTRTWCPLTPIKMPSVAAL